MARLYVCGISRGADSFRLINAGAPFETVLRPMLFLSIRLPYRPLRPSLISVALAVPLALPRRQPVSRRQTHLRFYASFEGAPSHPSAPPSRRENHRPRGRSIWYLNKRTCTRRARASSPSFFQEEPGGGGDATLRYLWGRGYAQLERGSRRIC